MKKKNSSLLPQLSPLTSKEKAVLLFLEDELLTKGISPSYQEICDHFGFASFNSVQNYLKQLSQKGYLHIPQNQKRAIQILHSAKDFHLNLSQRLNSSLNKEPSTQAFSGQSSHDHEDPSKVLSIPFLGRVAAGSPIERLNDNELFTIPANLISSAYNHFALKVEGDSMIEEGIFDGDFLVVQSHKQASNGDLVVATVNNESTVKRFFLKKNLSLSAKHNSIELRPANPRLSSMWYHPEQVDIKGLVKALIRKY